jgi:site-specific DNA-methyltransferase (adenine-specific)
MNEVIYGDCLEVMKEIPNQSVDLIITDPPYSSPTVSGFGRTLMRNVADLSIQEFYFRSIKEQFERILKPDGRAFVFCDDRYYPVLFGVFYSWAHKNLLIWDKGQIGLGQPFRHQHELIFYVNRQVYKHHQTEAITCFPTIMTYKHDADRMHPSQKPLALIERLVIGFSRPGEVVFDPFTGSGTTLVAASNLGRNYIGVELNVEYVEVARKRLSSVSYSS